MNKFKRSFGLAVATLVAVVGAGIAATPAQASATCTNGFACLYTSPQETGAKLTISVGTCHNFSGQWDNNISSVDLSASAIDYVFYTSYNCVWSGPVYVMHHGWYYDAFSAQYDNAFSSMGPA